MVAKSFCARSKSVNDCLSYQRTIITKENMIWLSNFPVFRRYKSLFMVHGGWNDPIDEYLKVSEEYFDRIVGQYFSSGHSHIQTILSFSEKTYCNPGSVGQPRDGDPRAAFATWNGKIFGIYRVIYDIQKVGTLIDKAEFNGYYYGSLKTVASNLRD